MQLRILLIIGLAASAACVEKEGTSGKFFDRRIHHDALRSRSDHDHTAKLLKASGHLFAF